MKKEYLFFLTGLLLTAIVFSIFQLTQASPVIPNPGHGTSALEGSADLNMAGYKIISVGTPTATGDASTKGYVDAAAGGVKYWEVCKTATAYTGDLGGYAGANAKCATDCGTGCVLLNGSHLQAAAYGGVILVPTVSTTMYESYWIGGAFARWVPGYTSNISMLNPGINGQMWGSNDAALGADCKGYTDSTGGIGTISSYGSLSWGSCATTLKLLCACAK